MTETVRRSAQEVFELLHDEDSRMLAGGWVIFDRVGDEWKFMATSSAGFVNNVDCTYKPSIEVVDSTLNRLHGGPHKMAGLIQTHIGTGKTMLFLLPVGAGIYNKE